MSIEGQPFKNSETCEGVAFVSPEVKHDIANIRITGRYPEEGWAMNEVSDEVVFVSEGRGRLSRKDEAVQDLEQGKAAFIPAGTWFAWDGDMTIVMSCNPAYSPEQYKWKEA